MISSSSSATVAKMRLESFGRSAEDLLGRVELGAVGRQGIEMESCLPSRPRPLLARGAASPMILWYALHGRGNQRGGAGWRGGHELG